MKPVLSSSCSLLLLIVAGCASIKEDHHLFRVDPTTGQPANFFRVRVRGWAGLSGARYIAGFYDERAVDLFFNQMKTADASDFDERPLFIDKQREPGGNTIQPLSPDIGRGTFVLVLSTNAKAVTDAIGQFADNQVAADALSNLISRSEVRELRRRSRLLDLEVGDRVATRAELDRLFALVPASRAPTQAEAERVYMQILNAIAATHGARDGFTSLNEATIWFDARSGDTAR